MKRRTNSELPEASINLTSLLDITFVLLISFMIVAPAVKYNVDIDLPKSSENNNVDERKPISVQVSYNADSKVVVYYVNGRSAPLKEVAAEIKVLPSFKLDSAVSLEGDRTVPWEAMARLMSHLTANGITNIGIITERGGGR